MSPEVPESYQPSDDEPFMNSQQIEYFRQRLMTWRGQLLHDSSETITHLQEEPQIEADLVDCAANETDRTIELRARDRERRLINKIEEALRRIEEGSYGYCAETGEPIGIKRLEARPIATLSLDAQERREHLRKQIGE